MPTSFRICAEIFPQPTAPPPADAASAPAWIADIFHCVAKDLPAA